MVFDALLTGAVVVLMSIIWNKFIKRKRVWVIDDSQSDLMLYKINLKLDDYDVRYFDSVRGLAFKLGLETPDAVIVDLILKDNVDGDQVLKVCERNSIPCILATAYDGDIVGIPKEKVLKKSANPTFYRSIENWVKGETA